MIKMNSREKALYEVQIAGFALDEANLFLDTHPQDPEALAAMREYQRQYREAVAVYENQFGPLTASSSYTDECWAWIKNPWPWDMED